MNKLMGFLELKMLGISTIDWNEYSENNYYDENKLWTIRTALERGNDLNLPRAVGIKSSEIKKFVDKVKRQYGDNSFIICYPYFIAIKSGTLKISSDETAIEAVERDLWNLVTYNKCDVTIIEKNNNSDIIGKKDFLSNIEYNLLKDSERKIRIKLRKEIVSGSTFLLEWSFAVNTDLKKLPQGMPYLIFYECRTI